MQWLSTLPVPLLSFLASLFAYVMTCLGAATIFLSKNLSRKSICFLNASAGGIMISASFFSLLLPAIERGGGIFAVVFGFLLGGILVLLSDPLLNRLFLSNKKKKSALFYTAVTLHNIPEGLAIGVAFASSNTLSAIVAAWLFAVGIGIQNFPEGACVSFSLFHDGCSRKRSFFYSQLSGSVEVAAALLGVIAFFQAGFALAGVLSLSAGAMIFVTCSELLPEAFQEHKKISSIGFLFGFTLMMLLDLAL